MSGAKLNLCGRTLLAGIVIVAWMGSAQASTVRVSRAPMLPASSSVELFALNTHESFHLRPDQGGRYSAQLMRSLSRFLRCHHTGRIHAIATRLADLIYRTGRHFNRRLTVVAGYRAPSVAREKGNPHSPHKNGFACDFRVDGVANTSVRDYVRTAFAQVGVGYYPNSDFVHLDVRPAGKKSAYWVDYSRPGERARYRPTWEYGRENSEPEMDNDEPEVVGHVSVAPRDSEPKSEIHVLADSVEPSEMKRGGVQPRLSAVPPF